MTNGTIDFRGILTKFTNTVQDYLPHVLAAAPPGAFAALARMDVGPGMPDFVGYDALLFVNMTAQTVTDPGFGIHVPDAYYATPLVAQGFELDPMFGGSGPVTLDAMQGLGVYATMIPEDYAPATYWMHGSVRGELSHSTLVGSLMNGQAIYLVPEPTSLATVAIVGMVALRRRC